MTLSSSSLRERARVYPPRSRTRTSAVTRAARRSAAGYVPFEELEDCLAGADEAVQTLETKELARCIERFLDTLNQEDRVIFLRRYWFADSCRQIAGRVGLSEKNVTVRLARMRRKLKEHLAGEGVSV